METQIATAKKGVQRDIYATITGKIIEKLNNGIVPWRVSWAAAGLPQNLVTGNEYQSVNRILLASLGYARNLFITSKQLETLDGAILPKERPHVISFFGDANYDPNADAADIEANPGKKELLPYTVFNIAQCKWDAGKTFPEVIPEFDPIPDCVPIKSKDQKQAYYNPLLDFINLPNEKTFPNKQAFLWARFHTLVHATGHHSRLNRKDLIQMSEFGYDAYSHEELVAEIGASYLMSHYGVMLEFTPSDEYISEWIKRFESDHYLIFSAAYQAEKAINFLFPGEAANAQ